MPQYYVYLTTMGDHRMPLLTEFTLVEAEHPLKAVQAFYKLHPELVYLPHDKALIVHPDTPLTDGVPVIGQAVAVFKNFSGNHNHN
jgi:hypothetical protein